MPLNDKNKLALTWARLIMRLILETSEMCFSTKIGFTSFSRDPIVRLIKQSELGAIVSKTRRINQSDSSTPIMGATNERFLIEEIDSKRAFSH